MPLHAYVGVNPALGQDVGGSQKAGKELQKAAGEETHCKFENAEEETKKWRRKRHWGKRYHQAAPLASPLFSTFDIYSLTFNAKRTSADDKENLSFFIRHFIFSRPPAPQRASHWPHKLNIIPLLTNHLVKSPFPCFIFFFFLPDSACFVHLCSMLTAVWPIAGGLTTNFIWTKECVFSWGGNTTGDTHVCTTYTQ